MIREEIDAISSENRQLENLLAVRSLQGIDLEKGSDHI